VTFEFRQVSPEVYYAPAGLVVIDDETIAWLIARAIEQPRMRTRICLHEEPGSLVHNMLIVHHRTAYVRPHRHFNRSETLTVVQGEARAYTYSADGTIDRVMPLGPVGSGRAAIYSMPLGRFHNLIIDSDWLVFQETTAGPFDATSSEFAPWSPVDADVAAVAGFMERLRGLQASSAACKE
jgi:cupin fold WbuC family metalloprotein